MKLNHLNLVVDDVSAARQFLERFFGLRPVGEGQKNFAILLDDEGFVLTLMGVGRGNQVSYPKTFHIGFIRPGRAEVDALHQLLSDEDFDIEAPREQHGAWSFSFLAPGGFTIVIRSEVNWMAGPPPGHGTSAHGHRHSR
jgi:catechol 2,3-dioxygenase-like lactoylglutathione lyase family enzyme